MTIDTDKIQAFQRHFVREREWDKFHTPKNLAMALAGEAGELLEQFQWLTEAESYDVMKETRKATQVRDELADVLFYLLRIADVLSVDLETAFWDKQKQNVAKYPVERSKGNVKKYTEWE